MTTSTTSTGDQKPTESDGRTNFDFLAGEWDIRHRQLDNWLAGSDNWQEFGGRSTSHPILGGIGNVDEVTMEHADGTVRGMTLRLFNPETRYWSIYWANSKTGVLDAPMRGRFSNGVGTFYNHEHFKDQWVISRFIWSGITATSCRWEQAFSVDGGSTWETNWSMDHTRTS